MQGLHDWNGGDNGCIPGSRMSETVRFSSVRSHYTATKARKNKRNLPNHTLLLVLMYYYRDRNKIV